VTETVQRKTSFTPGPWEAVEHDTAKSHPFPVGVKCRIVKLGGHTEADTICELVGQGENGKYSSETTDANARLIAAAPEMLEALEAVINYAPHEKWPFTPAVEAAIRKAKGL